MSNLKTLELKQIVEKGNDFVEANYVVAFRPFLTRKAQKEINAVMLGDAKMNAKDAKDGNIDLSMESINEAEDLTIVSLIHRVTCDDKNIDNIIGFVDDLSGENYDLIKKTVDEITGKKEKTLQKEKQDS